LHRLRPTAGAGRELSSSPTDDVLGDWWLDDRFMCKVYVGKKKYTMKTTPVTVPCSSNEENRLHNAAISSNNADTLSILAAF
jgi:hypothetical protein